MTGARDDYFFPVSGWAYETMISELDSLRRWKAEALEVITQWDACYDVLAAAGHPTQVGMRKSRHVAGYLKIAVDRETDDERLRREALGAWLIERAHTSPMVAAMLHRAQTELTTKEPR